MARLRTVDYPSIGCTDCGRGVVGRFSDRPPARCPACEATRERLDAYRKQGKQHKADQVKQRNLRILRMAAEPDRPSWQEIGRRVGVSKSQARLVWQQWQRQSDMLAEHGWSNEKVIEVFGVPLAPGTPAPSTEERVPPPLFEKFRPTPSGDSL